jgi:hypothetical protein
VFLKSEIFVVRYLNVTLCTHIYGVKKIMGVILIICGVFLMLKGFIPNEKIDELIY